MSEYEKFVREIRRVSREVEKVLNYISLNRKTVLYEEIVLQKLDILVFKEDFDNYQLADVDSDVYDWIMDYHNLSIKTRKIHYQDKIPLFDEKTEDIVPGKFISKEKKNHIEIELLKLDFNQFLEKVKDYRIA